MFFLSSYMYYFSLVSLNFFPLWPPFSFSWWSYRQCSSPNMLLLPSIMCITSVSSLSAILLLAVYESCPLILLLLTRYFQMRIGGKVLCLKRRDARMFRFPLLWSAPSSSHYASLPTRLITHSSAHLFVFLLPLIPRNHGGAAAITLTLTFPSASLPSFPPLLYPSSSLFLYNCFIC